uniref:TepA protein n=1 Tax=Spirodela intermedia TaxID=51605 RepID=A0A8S0XM17_SPIIN
MPIGVPKVPFRSPGEEDAVWVDITFLGQEVDSEISNQLVGLMVYLSIEDDTKDLYLFINSPVDGREFILEAEELLKLRETLTRVYVQRTGNPLWVVSEDMERDVLCQQRKPKLMALLILWQSKIRGFRVNP